MKKFYCFYCQKEVEPFKLIKWRFCPDCKRYMCDTGDGFYKVCDNCDANLPTDAARCFKCGYVFKGDNALKEYNAGWLNNSLVNMLVSTLIVLFAILFGIMVLYVSFYIFLVVLVAGAAWFLWESLRLKMH